MAGLTKYDFFFHSRRCHSRTCLLRISWFFVFRWLSNLRLGEQVRHASFRVICHKRDNRTEASVWRLGQVMMPDCSYRVESNFSKANRSPRATFFHSRGLNGRISHHIRSVLSRRNVVVAMRSTIHDIISQFSSSTHRFFRRNARRSARQSFHFRSVLHFI